MWHFGGHGKCAVSLSWGSAQQQKWKEQNQEDIHGRRGRMLSKKTSSQEDAQSRRTWRMKIKRASG